MRIPELGNMTQTDKSTIREIRKSLAASHPPLEPFLDNLIPKKSTAYLMRLKDNDKADLFIVDGHVIAFRRQKRWYPTLKVVHKCSINRSSMFQDISS